MSDTANTFVWYELLTTDIDAAEAFYRDVVGWTAQDSGVPGIRYTVLSAGTRSVAGVMTIPEEVSAAGGRPGWTGYVGVPDVDAAAEKLAAAGGAVHRAPDDIPGVGRFAVVADPQGVIFQLFRPSAGGQEPPSPMTPGHVGWHELYAADWEKSFAFYAGQFGWTEGESVDMGPMGTYQLFVAGDAPIGGMMNKPPHTPKPVWNFYFTVPGVDAAAARVQGGGGQVVMGPHQVPGGSWIAQCRDPQGASFAITAPRR